LREKYDEAIKKYSEAELRDPNSAIVQFNTADALYRQGQYEEAKNRYQKALNLTKDKNFQSKILYNLGNVSYKQQDINQAKEYYKQSLILDPKNSAAKYNLQQLLFVPQQQKQNKDSKGNKEQNNQPKQHNQNQEEKNSVQQEQKKYMSKQDVERLLEMSKQQNKDKQNILKPQKPKLPEVDKDW
jgi:tetratricopeptide (TPR) repeat protein